MNIYLLNYVGLLNGGVSRDNSYMYNRAELKNTKEMLPKFYENLKIKKLKWLILICYIRDHYRWYQCLRFW